MKRARHLKPEEIALWLHVLRDVAPMKGRQLPQAPAEPEKPASEKTEPEPKRRAALASLPPDKKPKLPPLAPIEKKLRQRVARGQRPVDMAIDLHGMRQAEAHGALSTFIHRAHQAGASIVLVVTGKGGEGDAGFAMEGERGVLRRVVPHWLADPGLRRFVIGFETAPRGHGGAGALYVRIRRAKG